MKKLILLFAISFLINGCSKDENQTNEEIETPLTINLQASSIDVMENQIVELTSDNFSFTEDVYEATFGGNTIQLFNTQDNSLSFSIPELTNQSNNLILIVNDAEGEVTFNVTENQINNIETVINEELLMPLQANQQKISQYISNGLVSPETIIQLNTAENIYNDFIAKFNSSTNEEKLELAKFLNANPVFTNPEILNFNKNSNMSDEDWDCLIENGLEIAVTGLTIAAAVPIIGPMLVASGPFSILVGAATLVGFIVSYAVIDAAFEEIVSVCLIPTKYKMLKNGNASDWVIANAAYDAFLLKFETETMNTEHIYGNSELVNTIRESDAMLRENNLINNFVSNINSIVSSASSVFNSFFNDNEYSDFEMTVYEAIPFESVLETEIDGDNSNTTFSNIPNDIQIEVVPIGESEVNLKFTAATNTLPRTFSGNVNYSDSNFEFSEPFTVTLEDEETDILDLLQSNFWHINKVGGGNFEGTVTSYDGDGNITGTQTLECCGGLNGVSFNENGTIDINFNSSNNYTINQFSVSQSNLSFIIKIESSSLIEEYSFNGVKDPNNELFTGTYSIESNEYVSGSLIQNTIAGGAATLEHN